MNDHSHPRVIDFESGDRDGYFWIVYSTSFQLDIDALKQFHSGLRLCITSFDSGTIRPNRNERDSGWTVQNNAMVSPPIADTTEIPHDHYDEWYITESPEFSEIEIEVFVNYCGFTLVPRSQLTKSEIDETQNRLDKNEGLRERFWTQLRTIRPTTFIACGDNNVIATKIREYRDFALDQLRYQP